MHSVNFARAGSLESKASKTSSERKQSANEMSEAAGGLGGGALKHEETKRAGNDDPCND